MCVCASIRFDPNTYGSAHGHWQTQWLIIFVGLDAVIKACIVRWHRLLIGHDSVPFLLLSPVGRYNSQFTRTRFTKSTSAIEQWYPSVCTSTLRSIVSLWHLSCLWTSNHLLCQSVGRFFVLALSLCVCVIFHNFPGHNEYRFSHYNFRVICYFLKRKTVTKAPSEWSILLKYHYFRLAQIVAFGKVHFNGLAVGNLRTLRRHIANDKSEF